MGIRDYLFKQVFRGIESSNRVLAQGERVFFESGEFAWIPEVEARFAKIRTELDGVLARVEALPNFQDIQQEQQNITSDDRWKIFPFRAYGVPFEPNLRRCPETAAALALIPGLTTAMFSVLRGPKKVPAHRGPFNGVLRYHLALAVPGDPSKCRIRVGSEWRTWHEGRSLVFDDTFEHEVVDDLAGDRVVLFVDFLRPAPRPLAWMNDRLVKAVGHTTFIQDSLRNMNRWNVDFEARPGTP